MAYCWFVGSWYWMMRGLPSEEVSSSLEIKILNLNKHFSTNRTRWIKNPEAVKVKAKRTKQADECSKTYVLICLLCIANWCIFISHESNVTWENLKGSVWFRSYFKTNYFKRLIVMKGFLWDAGGVTECSFADALWILPMASHSVNLNWN